MKKYLSVLLTIILVFSTMIINVSADNISIAKIKEYLVAPSQYTNSDAFGIHIENTLTGSGISSLGNFGGYVTYELTEPVINSNKHKYGVDFIISGNAFNGAYTTQEPGQVWVSQNGTNWFALAGSEHYEDETDWNYSVTYSKSEERKCTFTDSLGDSGTVSPATYPQSENYPLVNIPENNLTLSGILLRKERIASIKNGISTSFGYVDTLKGGSNSKSSNPYLSDPANNCSDGQFDISWAVDENGIGVNLDWIKYIKVQTATFIDGAMYGEKSTEISSIGLIYDNENEISPNEITSIQVGDKTIFPSANKNYYEVEIEDNFDVTVNTTSDSNVYINNSYGSEKHFDSKTDKGIIRVIVQSEESQPAIYYINTGKGTSNSEITISDKEKKLKVGDSFQLTAKSSNDEQIYWSSSDNNILSVDENGIVTAIKSGTAYILASNEKGISKSCKITVEDIVPPIEAKINFSYTNENNVVENKIINVKSNAAEKYGYEVAEKDHNGVLISNPTIFDALVTAHEAIYGTSFNKYTKDNYLIIESGFIIKAFEKNAASSGFLINGTIPNDGIINPVYNSFTGYSADTAQLKSGDNVRYYFYQDTGNFSDIYSWFDSSKYLTAPNIKTSIKVNGYNVMNNGLNDWNTIIDSYAYPLRNIEIFTYINDEKVILGTTNRKGVANVKFSESGEYIIYAGGNIKNSDGTKSPIITAVGIVIVDESYKPQRKGFFGWIINIWNSIINFFQNLF